MSVKLMKLLLLLLSQLVSQSVVGFGVHRYKIIVIIMECSRNAPEGKTM